MPITYVTFKSPGELADQAGKNVWDIGLIGAEPQRAAVMTFSAAYVEIEATYMVPPGSPLKSIADVDKKGVRLVVSARSAYGLWLENNIKNATLIQVTGLDGAFNKFMEDKADALAGLRPGLLKDLEKHPELKILDGKFTAVQQAVGCNKPATEGARYIAEFVENAKKSGLVASLIEKHKVKGLSVAPLAYERGPSGARSSPDRGSCLPKIRSAVRAERNGLGLSAAIRCALSPSAYG